jgi:hypothetical protein
MRGRSTFIHIAAVAAFVLLAHAATAGASVIATAQAIHTATHLRHSAYAHRRAHRHARRPVMRLTAERTQPITPAPVLPRPERSPRTAPPASIHTPRLVVSIKAGQRQMLAAPSCGAPLLTTVTPLDPDQNPKVNPPENPLISGRGPPRAAPTRGVASPHFARPSRSLSAAPDLPFMSGICLAIDRPAEGTEVRPSSLPVCSYTRFEGSERPSCRSRVRRLEGPAAWIHVPSTGGME